MLIRDVANTPDIFVFTYFLNFNLALQFSNNIDVFDSHIINSDQNNKYK